MTVAETSGSRLFVRSLADADRQAIEVEAEVRSLKVGQVLVHQGDPAEAMHILVDGLISRAKVLPDGRRQVTGLLVPGDCCDLHECLRQRSGSTLLAAADSTVAAFARDIVVDWIETRPSIARVLWQSALSREAILGEWLVNLGHRTPTERIAHLFCELLARLRAVGLAQDDEYDFPLRQHELAEIVGLSTVHVNRTLQALRAEGLISLRNYRLKILDVPRLQERAVFDPGYLERAQPDLPLAQLSRELAAKPASLVGE